MREDKDFKGSDYQTSQLTWTLMKTILGWWGFSQKIKYLSLNEVPWLVYIAIYDKHDENSRNLNALLYQYLSFLKLSQIQDSFHIPIKEKNKSFSNRELLIAQLHKSQDLGFCNEPNISEVSYVRW